MSRLVKPGHATTETPALAATDASRASGVLKRVGGSRSDDWNDRIIDDTLQALCRTADHEARDGQINAALSGLIGIGPKDELEGMIAAQLIASHSAAMECYRRAMIGEQTFEGRRENLSQANKLSRTFAVLLDALNRHRGKGQQKVTVEHVHVHQGGQAIVGAVHQRGGSQNEIKDSPYAPGSITHEPGTPMPRPDPQRETVPVASDTGTAPL
jgi:hypothetical protein